MSTSTASQAISESMQVA